MLVVVIDSDKSLIEKIKGYCAHCFSDCRFDEFVNATDAFRYVHSIVKDHKNHPNLIFLDPQISESEGADILQEIKLHEGLRFIPCIIVTSPQADSSTMSLYQMMANCVIEKAQNEEELDRQLEGACSFWLSSARLPGAGN